MFKVIHKNPKQKGNRDKQWAPDHAILKTNLNPFCLPSFFVLPSSPEGPLSSFNPAKKPTRQSTFRCSNKKQRKSTPLFLKKKKPLACFLSHPFKRPSEGVSKREVEIQGQQLASLFACTVVEVSYYCIWKSELLLGVTKGSASRKDIHLCIGMHRRKAMRQGRQTRRGSRRGRDWCRRHVEKEVWLGRLHVLSREKGSCNLEWKPTSCRRTAVHGLTLHEVMQARMNRRNCWG